MTNPSNSHPSTAMEAETAPSSAEPERKRGSSWIPTRKWIAARVTALGGLAILAVNTGSFGSSEWIATITLVSEGVVAWLIPNQSTSEGDGVAD